MCRPSPEAYVSVSELPPPLIELFERAAQPLLPGAQEPVKLLVRYLRRKPGRGLVVIYSVDEDHSTTKTHTQGAQRWVSVTLAEHMLEGARIHFTATAAQQAPFEIRSSGLLQVHDLGLSIQVFPGYARPQGSKGSIPLG